MGKTELGKRSYPTPGEDGEPAQTKFNVNLKNKRQRKATFQQWDIVQKKNSGQNESELTDLEISNLLESVLGPAGDRLVGRELITRLQLQASSRALQTLLKICDGSEEDSRIQVRESIYLSICCDDSGDEGDVFIETACNKFGWLVIAKMLKHIPEHFEEIADLIIAKSDALVVSKKAHHVWQATYKAILDRPEKLFTSKRACDGISPKQICLNRLVNRSVIPKALLTLHPVLEMLSLHDVVHGNLPQGVSDATKTKIVGTTIKKLSNITDRMMDKRLFDSLCLPVLLYEYLLVCEEEAKQKVVDRLMKCGEEQSRPEFALVFKLLATKEGTKLLSLLYGELDTKSRRALNVIARSNDSNEVFRQIFTNEGIGGHNSNAWWFFVRVLNALDDTKASTDLTKFAMKGVCSHNEGSDDINCPMKQFLIGTNLSPKKGLTIAPRGREFYEKVLTLTELSSEDKKNAHHFDPRQTLLWTLPNPKAKKSNDTRAKEVRENLSKPLSEFLIYHFKKEDEEVITAAINGELRDVTAEGVIARAEASDSEFVQEQLLPYLKAKGTEVKVYGRNRMIRAIVTTMGINTDLMVPVFESVFESRMEAALKTDLIWILIAFVERIEKNPDQYSSRKNILRKILSATNDYGKSFPDKTKKGEILLAKLLKDSKVKLK